MQVYSLFQNEISIKRVEVELHTRFQIPSFTILGLPAPEIQEARERIQAAFVSSGFDFPKKKVMVNLTPSSERKSGTGHDLAIALKILEQVLDIKWPNEVYAWGELGLNGRVKPCGHLAKWVELLLKEQVETLLVCSEDRKNLLDLLQWRAENNLPVPTALHIIEINSLDQFQFDFSFVGKSERFAGTDQKSAVVPPSNQSLLPLSASMDRAIRIAMVGRHHLLILGPKGMGKSQALEWITALSPPPDANKTWERVLHADSPFEDFNFNAPVRRVHAHLKPTHLLGSWNTRGFQPGELSRSHGGVLIADEFLEWPRDAKECLREPLEQKKYSLTRKQGTVRLACDLQFVATGNLCPCGGLPSVFNLYRAPDSKGKKKFPPCRCRPAEVHQYMSKLSGPVADRIDLVLIHIEAPELSTGSYCEPEAIAKMKESVAKSREFCLINFGAVSSELGVAWLEENLPKDIPTEKILGALPSLRSRHKIFRIARSIQALELSKELRAEHLLEAMSFRFEGVQQ